MSASLSVLDDFDSLDGEFPNASLITDADGDLFGTTGSGGANGDGTVFEITDNPVTGYAGTPVVLTSFDGLDGSAPEDNLLADAKGDLFGTTEQGGANGGGTAFEIVRTANGYASPPTVLVNFAASAFPRSNLIADANGDLFGVTVEDGAYAGGTVFEIARTASGYAATPTILTNFSALAGGDTPIGGLITDAAGDLFGTTDEGGANGYGTLFEIARTAGGYAGTPTVLVNFDAGTFGQFGSLVADASGDLFGTSADGGAYSGGAVYELVKTASGYASAPVLLASFNGPVAHNGPELNTDGSFPVGTLIIDAQGDLLGTTEYGGTVGYGVVYEIAKTGSVYAATPTVLHSFSGSDGAIPVGGLAFGAGGTLVGTTQEGGANNSGTVFALTLPPKAEIFSQVQAATSGPLAGSFLWSNAANWTDGVPFDNDSALSQSEGIDDVAGLSLFELALSNGGSVTAVQNLAINTLITDASSSLFASTTLPGGGAGVTVSVGTFSGTGGNFGAVGSGAVLADNAATSPGAALYIASAGGEIAVAHDLTIGGATAGALEVASGGKVTSVNGDVGTGAGAGAVTIDGPNSSWSMSGALTIGASGGTSSPSVTISDDASVTTSTSGNSVDGLVDGSLTLMSDGRLTEYGLSMSNAATLTVESGATLTETAPSPMPNEAGLIGNGEVVLNGGNLYSPDLATAIGVDDFGMPASGTMTVSAGALATNLLTVIGQDEGGDTGTLRLGGSGTKWTDTYGAPVDDNDAGLNVGVSGTGSLAITAGATLTNPLAYIKVAQFGGSVGTVVVSDAGSSLDAGGLLRVGDQGNGTMTVENGATASVGQVQVGDYNGSTGRLDIDSGASVTTNSASTIDVGPQAIQGGTIQVAAGSFETGVQAGSFGFVDVDDGTLTVEGDLMIGGSGSGTLSVESGGVVSAVGVTVGVAATLVLGAGGTLHVGSITINGGYTYMSGGVLDPPGQITVDAGGDIAGFGTIDGSIDDTGRVTATGGTLDITGDVSGTGPLTLTSPASLQLDGIVTNAAGILFSGADESLILGAGAKIETAISGLYNDDKVALDGQTIVLAVYTAATGALALAGSNGAVVDLTLLGAHQQNDFTLVDGDLQVACFARGTRVLTMRGEVAVEALRPGDLLVTLLDPDAVLKPVRWLGHRRLDLRRHPSPDEVQPVRLRAGALGDEVPHHDLIVSPGHRFLLNGALVAACELINGATIVQERWDEVEYWHVELDRHDVLLAEGMAAETYHDVGNRDGFETGAVVSLHPSLDQHRHAAPCRPYGLAAQPLRERLFARAEALGWIRVTEPAPWLEVDGQILRPEQDGDDYRFELPANCEQALLRSRTTRPRDVDAHGQDERSLGLSLARLTLQGPSDRIDVALDDGRLSQGFREAEAAGGQAWRWTNGCAVLPVAALLAGTHSIEIQINRGLKYWTAASQPPTEQASALRRRQQEPV